MRYGMSAQSRSGGGGGMHTPGYDGSQRPDGVVAVLQPRQMLSERVLSDPRNSEQHVLSLAAEMRPKPPAGLCPGEHRVVLEFSHTH